jgi:Tfp pilus assembly protein PilO
VSQRDRILIAVVAFAAVIAGFWFAVLAPKRAEVSDIGAKVAEQEQRRDTALQTVAIGENARSAYGSNYATVARLGKAVPATDQTPSLLFQLESAAKQHKIDFRSLKLEATAPAAATGGDGAATPADQAAAAAAPPGSTVGPAGFPRMPYDLVFDGSFFDIERFLSSIEKFTSTSSKDVAVRGRLLTIDGIYVGASRDGFPNVSASVSASAYVLPATEGAFAGATPSGPASAATPASGGSPSPSKPAAAAVTGVR